MNKKDWQKSLLEMARGGFMERIDYEMPKMLANILDPNTRATEKRKLTITIVFQPSDDRHDVAVGFVVKPTLAATNPLRTNLYITADDSTGELQVVEMTPQIPGQLNVDGTEQEPPAILKLVNY